MSGGARPERRSDPSIDEHERDTEDLDAGDSRATAVTSVDGAQRTPEAPAPPKETGAETLGLVADTEEVLAHISMHRASPLLWIAGGAVASAYGMIPITPHVGGRIIGTVAITMLLALLVVIGRHLGQPGRSRRVFDRLVTAAFFPTALLHFYFGPFGNHVGIVGLVLFLYNVSAPTRFATTATLMVAVPHVVLHLATTFGLVPDRSMVEFVGTRTARLVGLLQVVGVYGLGYWFARAIHASAAVSLSRLQEAFRQMTAREALLREARAELERAAGVGQPGRFTGQRLGSFVLGPLLGRGGMGDIYEAEHSHTKQEAAVKLLRREQGSEDDLITRFEREAGLLADLRSPHIVSVLEVGGREAELPYLAMERLRGADLAALLQSRLRLGLQETADMAAQVATGLEAAWVKGVVHRDIKPQNLFRTTGGTWKILDFGLAATVPGEIGGTPGYMAPEQLHRSSLLDHRADVHALASVVYRCLTGRPPFSGGDPIAVLRRVKYAMPPRPSSLGGLPADLDDVLRVAFAKDPRERLESAHALAEALRAIELGRPIDEALRERAQAQNAKLGWPG